MKSVLLVNDHIHFGGGGDAVFNLEKKKLLDSGYDVKVIGFGNSKDTTDNVHIIESAKNEKISKFIGNQRIKNNFSDLVDQLSPDLIHLHLISKFPLSIYNAQVLKKIPTIQTLHGPNLFCATSWGGLKNSGPCELGIGSKCFSRGCVNSSTSLLYSQLQKRYWNSLLKNIDAFHCPSLNILNSARRLGLMNSRYIPLGIDEIFLNDEGKTTTDRPTLIYVGALAEQKGVNFLIPALVKIKKIFPRVLLRIAGRGELLEKLKSDTISKNLENNIEFMGFVGHSEIKSFYLSGDVFVMPSIWQEQFGLVGPEALACRLPCVGTNVGGIPEWLRHNENGLLVPPQDSQSLADAVIHILSNPEIKKQMGERGRQFVLQEFSPNKYAKNLKSLINSLL